MLQYKNVKSESEWNREFCKELLTYNAQVFACVASHMQTPGWPDRYIAHPLFCGWVEVKRMKNDLSGLQANLHMKVNRMRPGTMFVLWLEHDLLYPQYISWFSPHHKNNAWPNIDVSGIVNALGIIKQLASLQQHESAIARKEGNYYV